MGGCQGRGARAKPKRPGRTSLNFRGYTDGAHGYGALQERGDGDRFMAVVDPLGVDFKVCTNP